MGGMSCKRAEFSVQLAKAYSEKLNRYDEPIGDIIIGVQSGDSISFTRIHVWSITKKGANHDKSFITGLRGVVRVAGGPLPGRSQAGDRPTTPQPVGSPCQAFIVIRTLEFCQ